MGGVIKYHQYFLVHIMKSEHEDIAIIIGMSTECWEIVLNVNFFKAESLHVNPTINKYSFDNAVCIITQQTHFHKVI